MSTDRHAPGYAVFRPRRARVMAIVVGALSLIVFVGLAVVVTELGQGVGGVADRVLIALVGVVLAGGMYRYASVAAIPSRQGLVVRNVFTTTNLEWAQIVGARMGSGDPWVYLDLSDGETLAVMAVQRTDAAHGIAEYSRLAALVDLHPRTDEDGV